MEKEQQEKNNREEALRLHHEQYSKELSINLSEDLIRALSGGGFQPPNEGYSAVGVDDRLDQLRILSKDWDRLAKKRKINDDEGLWNRLLDACRDVELETLRQQGYGEKSATKLVRVVYAWWDPDSHQFLTGPAPHDTRSSVQVVVVLREMGLRIHEEILHHLWQHPAFSEELSRNAARNPRDGFNNTLESVDGIAKNYPYEYWEYFPPLDELDDPDRRAVDCIIKVLELRYLLESRGSEGGDFLENVAPKECEHLAWLSRAKEGERLWKLLNAAVELGRMLNHYSTFRDANIEETIRSLHNAYPGKGTTDAGKAIERIISAAIKSGIARTTPKELLKWLEGKRPSYNDDALVVSHPLWGPELREVTWEKFENLVKSAKRRQVSTRS